PQLVGDAQGQGDDGEGGEAPAAGGEDRAAGDVEVVDAVHAALAVDHAAGGRVRHPGGAEVVGGAVQRRGRGRLLQPGGRLQAAAEARGDVAADQAGAGADAGLVELAHAPVDADPAQAERVAPVGQADPAVAIGRLFEVAHDLEPVGFHRVAAGQFAQRRAGHVAGA